METTSGENSEININLKVISQINEGDKLFVSQNLLQIDRSQRGIANASVRWYNNESRQQTMIQLNKKLIAQNLDQSIKGLIELKKTYTDDPTIVAQIDVLMEEIKEKREMNFKSFNSVNSNIEDNVEDNVNKNSNGNSNNNSKSKKNK